MRIKRNVYIYTSLVIILSVAIFIGASPKKTTYVQDHATNTRVAFDSIYKKNKFTYIYAWTTWCPPCVQGMKSKLPKYKELADSLGVPLEISTILFTNEEISDKVEGMMVHARENGVATYLYKTVYPSGFQKLSVNKVLGSIIGYESRNHVPVRLLVNENGEIILDDENDTFSFESIQKKIESIQTR